MGEKVKAIVCQKCGCPFFVHLVWVNDIEYCPKCNSTDLGERSIYNLDPNAVKE